MENKDSFREKLVKILIDDFDKDYIRTEKEILQAIYDYIEEEMITMDIEVLQNKDGDYSKMTKEEKKKFDDLNDALDALYVHIQKMNTIMKYYKKRRPERKKIIFYDYTKSKNNTNRNN
jgi:ribosome-binding ATPase YchF (GTP1/OBG family)